MDKIKNIGQFKAYWMAKFRWDENFLFMIMPKYGKGMFSKN